MNEAQKTPAARWRQDGQADPHGDHYSCQRAALTLGEYTDDELANGVFLHGNEPLNINALLRKTPGYHSAVVWLTAGKDRIRWLSRALEESAAREQALQLRLNAADQRIDDLERDKARLDALEANCWDVRYDSSPNGDAGDSSISIEIVGHWMDKPNERVIGEDYSENLRAAIDQAMTAPAYPPARPEYPELDEHLEREHQIPGTSGMRLNMLANQGE
ncbi:hypothetical protein D3C87_1219120 [compost metagenome]